VDARARRLLARLVQEYPLAFGTVQPLVVGIADQIADKYPDADPGVIDRTLYRWCRQRAYQVAVMTGQQRVHLSGEIADKPEQRHRLRAGKVLLEMKRRK
jgi:sRNA-binding protein